MTVLITLVGSKVELEAPEKFNGNAQKLSNFMFKVRTYDEVLGISDIIKQVKFAIILLTGPRLIW